MEYNAETAIDQLIEDLKTEKMKRERDLKSCFESLAKEFSREGGPSWNSSSVEGEWKILRAEIDILDESIRRAIALKKFMG